MPRALAAALLLAGCAVSGLTADARRIGADFTVRRVAPDTFVATQETFYDSNVLLARMGDGTVVICSSPFETEGTRALLAWVKSELSPRRMVAVNTHFHSDGSAGNEAYHEAGVETWASDLTHALFAKRTAAVRDEDAARFTDPALRRRVAATGVVPAARTFPAKEGLLLTFGSETVRVVYPGPAHSPDNVVVHFPARRVLFGGCMVKGGRSIGYTGDAALDKWEAAVRAVEPLEAGVVVPGHGPVGGPELLRNTIEVVRTARAAP